MRLSTYAALICCVFLLGCSSDDSNNAALPDTNLPYIGDVYSRIEHYHPSYWTKNGTIDDVVYLKLSLDFQVLHGDGINSLRDISVHSSEDDLTFGVLGGSGSLPLSAYYEDDPDADFPDEEFSTLFINTDDRNLINLKGYHIKAVDQADNEVVRYFDFKSFQGEPLEGKTYVYRNLALTVPEEPDEDSEEPEFTPTFEGLSALEAMTVARNELTFTADITTQSFTIEFYHRDRRSRDYKVQFYGPEPERSLLGIADFRSASINSTPLVPGVQTRLVIPFAEVALLGDAQIEDIEGIHVVLADTVFEKAAPAGELTARYFGYSEFVTLPDVPEEPAEPEIPVEPELPAE